MKHVLSLHSSKFASLFFVLLLMIGAPLAAQEQPTKQAVEAEVEEIPTNTWAVTLAPGSNPSAVAASLGYQNLGQIGTLENVYLFRAPVGQINATTARTVNQSLDADVQVIAFEQQVATRMYHRDPNDDPQFANQWHLNNTIPGAVGEDINVIPAWNAGFTGTGVQIAVVDDGLQHDHPDIAAPKYVPEASYDYNGGDPNPYPGNGGDAHGTSAAGVAAAADNTTCGVGSAYNANLAGIRLIAAPVTDAQTANAENRANGAAGNPTNPADPSKTNDIYTNSWGPQDTGGLLVGPGPLTRNALQNGVLYGRGGLGSIYLWAAGNGLVQEDNVNADGYANSRFVIAVSAVDYQGVQSWYSEPGAPILVTAPSSGSSLGITTSDIFEVSDPFPPDGWGYEVGDCNSSFGGTSSATPLVAGVTALMLQANPNLTWRDVMHILVHTSEQNDPTDSDWTLNGGGLLVNHKYGFGRVDAEAAVNAALTWTNVKTQYMAASPVTTVNLPIPDPPDPGAGAGVTSTVNIRAGLALEHVEVVFKATHPYRGDLEVVLTSPSGTESRLMESRINDFGDNYNNWTFSSVHHWDESSDGDWTIRVVDRYMADFGTFNSWQLKLYGTAAETLPPTPTTPVNGSTISTALYWADVTLRWNNINVFDASRYEVQLDTIDPPVATIDLGGTPGQYIASLPPGTYFWRIRSRNIDDVPFDWSDTFSFTIVSSTNVAPLRNFYDTDTITLTWNRLSWAVGYEIEVSRNAAFTDLVVDNNTLGPNDLSFPVGPLDDATYYWRVRGKNSTGQFGAWSPTESFTIDVP